MTRQGINDVYMFMVASWPLQYKTWTSDTFQAAKFKQMAETFKDYKDEEVMKAFAMPDAVLTAPETRSSSPVRILRTESARFRNLSTRRSYVSRIFGNDSSNGMKSGNSCENPKSVRVFRYARVSNPELCHTSTS